MVQGNTQQGHAGDGGHMFSISRNVQWRWRVSAKTGLQKSTFMNAKGSVVIKGLGTDTIHGLRQGTGRNSRFVWAGFANSDIVYTFPWTVMQLAGSSGNGLLPATDG